MPIAFHEVDRTIAGRLRPCRTRIFDSPVCEADDGAIAPSSARLCFLRKLLQLLIYTANYLIYNESATVALVLFYQVAKWFGSLRVLAISLACLLYAIERSTIVPN